MKQINLVEELEKRIQVGFLNGKVSAMGQISTNWLKEQLDDILKNKTLIIAEPGEVVLGKEDAEHIVSILENRDYPLTEDLEERIRQQLEEGK